MKNTLIAALFTLSLAIPSVLFAQKAPTTTQSPTSTTTVASQPAVAPDTTTLLGRQTSIETDLRALFEKLTDLHVRTSSAIARLAQNKVDTKDATKALTTASEKLAAAEKAIDAFAAIEITPTTTVAPAPLIESLKKAETSLRDARSSIVEGLLKLRTSITIEEKTQ